MKKQISAKQRTETPLPPLDFWGFLRWTWRQLTSMNTALLLLLLVALAAIPGSILPQKFRGGSGVSVLCLAEICFFIILV